MVNISFGFMMVFALVTASVMVWNPFPVGLIVAIIYMVLAFVWVRSLK